MADTEVTTFRIPRELKAAAAARAKAEYRTLTDVVVQALREYAGSGPVPVWAVPERGEPVADFAEPAPPRVPLTGVQRASVGAPPKRRRKPESPRQTPSGRRPPAPAPAVEGPPRCNHPGTRSIGGWCSQCDRLVKVGGW